MLFDAKMRETPLDENEIARLHMLRASRKPIPNPKWYTPPRAPATFKFKAGAAPVFPAHVKPNTIRKPLHVVLKCLDGPFKGGALDVSDAPALKGLVLRIGDQVGHYERTEAGGALAWIAA